MIHLSPLEEGRAEINCSRSLSSPITLQTAWEVVPWVLDNMLKLPVKDGTVLLYHSSMMSSSAVSREIPGIWNLIP